LENPADFVRVEIEAALARDMRVIPVLVEDAKMPSPDELPHGLVPFTLKNALRLRGVWWREDVDGLLLALERIAEEKPGAERAEQAERKRAEQARHERAKRERAERDARERAEQEQVEQAREADERRRTQTGIFICYRREDSRWQARLLADALQERFGEENVFVDVERIGIGSWRAQIAQALDASAVVLVVIGPNWLEELERRGEGKDEVRFEIAAAITRGIPILPVTLAGVEVPDRGVLPEDIAALVDEQVWPLGQDQLWKPSVDILIRALASSFEAGISEAASDAP
jgi:hypothetical protein